MKINPLNCLLAKCLLLITFAANAFGSNQVYRCEQNGVAIFSQVPCEKDAKSVTVKPSQGKGLSLEQAKNKAKLKNEQNKLDRYLNTQDIEQQIAQHYRRIAQLKRDIKTQLTELKQQRFRTPMLRDEAFDALELGYQNNIKSHHEAIKRLNKQLSLLQSSAIPIATPATPPAENAN